MNIQFKRVEASNFLSLGQVQYDITNAGFVLVRGENKNPQDNASSNGSGKSSIFEALVWALTGETIRGTKEIVHKKSIGGTYVTVEFTVDADDYKITRYREHEVHSNTLLIEVNGEDVSGKGVRDTEKILQGYLPDLNGELLGSVIVLGQGLPHKFSSLSPVQRKDTLERLAKSDFIIEDIKNNLKDNINTLKKARQDIEKSIYGNDREINLNNSIIDERNKDIESNKYTKEQVDNLIEKDRKDILSNQTTIRDMEITLKELLEEKTLKQQEQVEVDKNYMEQNQNNNMLKYEINQILKHIREVEEAPTICGQCKRPFDESHKLDITKDKIKLEELQTKQVQSELEFKSVLDQKNAIQTDIYVIDKEMLDINTKLSNSKNKIRDLELNIQYLSQIQLKITMWLQDIKKANERITELNKSNIELNTNLENINQRLDILNKLYNLANKEFRVYLLENIVEYIQVQVKRYSKELFNTTYADFRLDKNNIWIGYDNKQYESLSGGERQKIDISIQFALRDMLMTLLNFSCNLLVLDELFDNLDELGSESLVELLTDLKDVDSVFIITHHAHIPIPYDKEIIISKNEKGFSEIINR